MWHHIVICCVLTWCRFAAVMGLISIISFSGGFLQKPKTEAMLRRMSSFFFYLFNFLIQHLEKFLLTLRGVDAPGEEDRAEGLDDSRSKQTTRDGLVTLTVSFHLIRAHPRVDRGERSSPVGDHTQSTPAKTLTNGWI